MRRETVRPETVAVRAAPAQPDLFSPLPQGGRGAGGEGPFALAPGAALIRAAALARADDLFADLQRVLEAAPPRHMLTPGGFRMSVAMSNAGALGWVTDESGYRYSSTDPDSGRPWPPLPAAFVEVAREAARAAGYAGFAPDACLISRYEPGARLTLHQDRDEGDFGQPIVSISLGLPAVFLFGGAKRSVRATRVPVQHGDAVVWGGPARLYYHGVSKLADGTHPVTGRYRFNLSFRCAR
jgi:alkylated DNA repair protein (DNA oxidative demethylase)